MEVCERWWEGGEVRGVYERGAAGLEGEGGEVREGACCGEEGGEGGGGVV